MRIPTLALAAFLIPATASAYQLSGYMWDTSDLPLVFYTSDYLEDSLPQTPDAESGLYYQEQAILKSYCNWNAQPNPYEQDEDGDGERDWWGCDDLPSDTVFFPDEAECAEIQYVYGGIHAGHEGPTNEGVNKVYFDDPDNTAGSGVNGFMRPRTANILVKEVGGEFIYKLVDADIVFNDNIDWGTTDDIDAGCVGGEMAVESTSTHEVGHLWGMGHSCEQDDVCINDAFLVATMFWTGGSCDTTRASPSSDDIQGLTALYGPFATFSTADERFGKAPLDICFDLVTEDEILSANWNFGDGDYSEDLEPCHTYEEQGQYTVTAELIGNSDTCGEWSFDYRELAYVLVCEVPTPHFSAQEVDGAELTWQMINATDVSTYGCIDEISWRVYDGDELDQEIGAWAPKIEFSAPGNYRIELVVGGHAGNAVAEINLEVGASTDVSCSTGGSRRGLGLAGLLVLGVLLRRRR